MPDPADVLEALLFASDTPLEPERIREVLELPSVEAARALVEELSVRYAARGLQIVEVGGGYRMVTRPELQPWLVRLTRSRTKQRLSRPALETLAIVAYKQPVSRPEVDAIRGVNSEAVLENLLERRLIRIPGRKDAPGRPYLFKILAQAGLGSRRRADGLIAEGHVAVNGVVTRNLATLADPDADRITVDGRPLPPPEARHYLLLNKPRGYVTTLSDPQGRPVVADLVDVGARLYPVGRLDWDVEGALLLTNDGALTHRLLHPRYGLPRVYEAEVEGRVAPGALARWRRGAVLDDGPATPVAVELVRARADASRLRLTFTEGRKHEVKRYCQALGHPVVRLRRVAFGPVALGALAPGALRRLTPRELAALRAAVADRAGGRRER